MCVIASDAGRYFSNLSCANGNAGREPSRDYLGQTAADRRQQGPVLVPARGHSDSTNPPGSDPPNSACPVRGTALVNRVPMSGRRKALLIV